jgi:hypothetical protein
VPKVSEVQQELCEGMLLMQPSSWVHNNLTTPDEVAPLCLARAPFCGAQAWEYMGAIMEREQAYKDAADHYEQV